MGGGGGGEFYFEFGEVQHIQTTVQHREPGLWYTICEHDSSIVEDDSINGYLNFHNYSMYLNRTTL